MGKLKKMCNYKPCQDRAIDLSQCCSPNQPINIKDLVSRFYKTNLKIEI